MATDTLYTEEFYQNQLSGSYDSASVILPLVLDLVSVTSACDVGCGVGTWLKVLREQGVEQVLGIDGNYVNRDLLKFPVENFLPHDLRKGISLEQQYDLVISLEVAEHLPPECAETFIESLVGLGPLILFSAAIPYQDGVEHVNLQWQSYWASLFKQHDYVPIDLVRPCVWTNSRVKRWYAQNTLIYCSREFMETQPRLVEKAQETNPSMLSIVHPRQYTMLAESNFDFERDACLSLVLGALPRLLLKAVKNRIGWVN